MDPKIEKLGREILEHKYRYYILANPSISDTEYDLLEREYKKMLIDAGLDPLEDSIYGMVGYSWDHPWSKKIERKLGV